LFWSIYHVYNPLRVSVSVGVDNFLVEIYFSYFFTRNLTHPSPSATWGCKSDFPKSYRTTPMCAWLFFDLFTRFVTVSIASTPVLPLRMPPPRRISCFETHVDHPQKWDFWIHHRRSAEKVPSRAKQLYIRLTGSRAVINRYTSEAQSPVPGTSHFGMGWNILEGHERSWGWVLGLSFCVRLFFYFCYV
jgi:hypothetical protein